MSDVGQPDDRAPAGPHSFPESGANSIAGPGQRLLARLLDGLVLMLPAFVVLLATVDLSESDAEAPELPLGAIVGLLGLTILYETVFVAWRGQTPGKMALGVRVARFADGEIPSWSAAALRVLVPTVASALPFGLGLLGLVVYLSLLWDSMRRGWHDKAAGTVVVRTR